MALTIDQTWEIMRFLLKNPKHSKSIISENQISSYNDFLDEIPKILEGFSDEPICSDDHDYPVYNISFSDISFEPPCDSNGKLIYPTEASLRLIQYESAVKCTVTVTKLTSKKIISEKKEDFLLMKLPVMVGSKICNTFKLKKEQLPLYGEDYYEMGGYFYVTPVGTKREKIGNGNVLLKRVVYGQERIAYNKIYFDTKKHRKSEKNLPYVSHVEFRSMNSYSTMTIFSLGVNSDHKVRVCLPWIPNEYYPVIVLLYALGKDLEFFRANAINHPSEIEYFEKCLEDAHLVSDKKSALIFMAKSESEEKIKYIEYIINDSLFCNLNDEENSHHKKALFLMYLYQQKLAHCRGEIQDTERDYFSNKRAQSTGTTMTQQFYSTMKKMFADIKKKVAESINSENITDPLAYYEEPKISNSWKKALINNNWNVTLSNKESVVQKYETANRMAKIAALNKLYLGMGGKEGEKVKVIEPRDLHLSQIGFIDCYDTPEGGKVGLLKNSAVTCIWSPATDGADVRGSLALIESYIPIDDVVDPFLYFKVFINGSWVGVTEDLSGLVHELRRLRRELIIDKTVTIYSDKSSVHILTDQGRLLRPLLCVFNGELVMNEKIIKSLNKKTFDDLYKSGVIDLLGDFELEEEHILVAENPNKITSDHTHCEIHETMIAGFLTNDNPFFNRNPAARNCYEDSMKKQAMGYPETNFMQTFQDGLLLNYPQKSLCSTRYSYELESDELPSEQCMIVGFISDDNEEDCIIMNSSSIDRGLGQYTLVAIYSVELGEDATLDVPLAKDCDMERFDYSLVSKKDPIVKKGAKVNKDQVLISITTPNDKYDPQKAGAPGYYEKPLRNESIAYDSRHHGIVDAVQILESENGKKIIRVRVLQKRRPMIGDKFSAKHGQKGTVVHLRRQEDMPFNQDGMPLDVIFGPAAIPSRMTAAFLVEILMSKAVATADIRRETKNSKKIKDWLKLLKPHLLPDGRADATAFIPELTVEKISEILRLKGWQCYGEESLINGMTGLPLKGMVFCGPASYHQLLHIAELKSHARSYGQTTSHFRQPVDGKKKGGGMRTGVQERDVMISKPAPGLLDDALHIRSDPYTIRVCPGCGLFRDEPNYCNFCEKI